MAMELVAENWGLGMRKSNENAEVQAQKMLMFESAVARTEGSESFRKFAKTLRKTDEVLDLGTGYAVCAVAVAKKVRHVTTVDIELRASRRLMEARKLTGVSNIDFVLGDVRGLKLPPKFDKAAALAFSPYPSSVGRIYAALKPGGTLFVADTFKEEEF